MRSIETLGEEYAESAEIIRTQIAERLGKLKKVSPFSREAGIIKSELGTLYRQRAEANDIAAHLKNYYVRGM